MAKKTMYRGFELIIDLEIGEALAVREDRSVFAEIYSETGAWEVEEDAHAEIRREIDSKLDKKPS